MTRAVLLIEALDGEDRRDELLERARLRRNLRDQANPLTLSDTEFRAHYRLSKELFSQLCHELKPHMPAKRRRTKVSLECKVWHQYLTYQDNSISIQVIRNLVLLHNY